MEILYLITLGLVATACLGLAIFYSWKARNWEGKDRVQNMLTHFGEGSFSETVKAKTGAIMYLLASGFWALAAISAAFPIAQHFDKTSLGKELARDQAVSVVEESDGSTLTVAELLAKFAADKQAASRMFSGKRVSVKDVIEKVSDSEIWLKNPATDRDSVKCRLQTQEGTVGGLQPGLIVTVRGVFQKRALSGAIHLTECAIAPTAIAAVIFTPEEAQSSQAAPAAESSDSASPDLLANQQVVEVKAEPVPIESSRAIFTVANLLTEFASSNKDSTKQFKGQLLTVRDKVEKVGKHDLFLKNTSDADSVKCTLPSSVVVSGVQVGATITVRGVFRSRRLTGKILLSDCELIDPASIAP